MSSPLLELSDSARHSLVHMAGYYLGSLSRSGCGDFQMVILAVPSNRLDFVILVVVSQFVRLISQP